MLILWQIQSWIVNLVRHIIINHKWTILLVFLFLECNSLYYTLTRMPGGGEEGSVCLQFCWFFFFRVPYLFLQWKNGCDAVWGRLKPEVTMPTGNKHNFSFTVTVLFFFSFLSSTTDIHLYPISSQNLKEFAPFLHFNYLMLHNGISSNKKDN